MSADTIKIRRGQAEELIEAIRRALIGGSFRETGTDLEATIVAIERALDRLGIPPLERCTGEAHGNPHIDNCWACAPRWGIVGPKVRVT